MDLTESPAEQAFRAEARAWLEANVPRPALPSGDTRDGFAAHLDWERALFEAGWSVVSWPNRYGGRDASLWEWLIFEEEYYRAGAPQRVTQNGIFLLAPSLFEFGTPEQRDRILPRMAAGQELWAQGWSEPAAGSDLAGITSRAERDEAAGGWRLYGQKTWTTRGAFCTHLFGLFRTDPAAERHRGLTYFLADLRSPGVEVRGFERLDGDEGFADVYFDGAFVPERDVLGEVDRDGRSRWPRRARSAADLAFARPVCDGGQPAGRTRPLRQPGLCWPGFCWPGFCCGDRVVPVLDRGPRLPPVHARAGHRHRGRRAAPAPGPA